LLVCDSAGPWLHVRATEFYDCKSAKFSGLDPLPRRRANRVTWVLAMIVAVGALLRGVKRLDALEAVEARSSSPTRNGGSAGQAVWLHDGKVGQVAAVLRTRELRWPSISTASANISLLLHELADLGAKDGPSSLALGKGAAGISAGVLYGGLRPVATFLGVRAQSIGARQKNNCPKWGGGGQKLHDFQRGQVFRSRMARVCLAGSQRTTFSSALARPPWQPSPQKGPTTHNRLWYASAADVHGPPVR
jgi:hypothetical protein